MINFLDHGYVNTVLFDQKTRKICFNIKVPLCVFQPAIPFLTKDGMITEFKISSPLAIWIPNTPAQFELENTKILENFWNETKKSVQQILELWVRSEKILTSQLTSILPIGLYVEFNLVHNIDMLVIILHAWECDGPEGEFRWALTESIVNQLKA
jgi:hypothetical protein